MAKELTRRLTLRDPETVELEIETLRSRFGQLAGKSWNGQKKNLEKYWTESLEDYLTIRSYCREQSQLVHTVVRISGMSWTI